jgi:hypothetical protein
MGEDRFKQFMKTVENITEAPVEKLEPILTTEENNNEDEVNKKADISDELIVESEVKETLAKPEDTQIPVQIKERQTTHSDTMSDLFVTGIDFLQKLGNTINDVKTGKTSTSSFIEKDTTTGKPYFKIPVPDEKVVEQALNALSGLLQLFKKD